MRKLRLLLMFTLLVTSNSSFAVAEDNQLAPQSWIQPDSLGFEENDKIISGFGKSIDRILNAQKETLERLELQEAPSSNYYLSKRPKDWVPWRMVAFIGDLALSASGSVGILGLGGKAFAKVYWQKKKDDGKVTPQKVKVGEDPNDDTYSGYLLPIAENISEGAFSRQVEKLTKAILSTGRINNGETFRQSFSKEAQEFRERVFWLNQVGQRGDWFVSRYRLDLVVGGSGTVSFGKVGGELSVRLEWHRVNINCTKCIDENTFPEKTEKSKIGKSLQGFVMSIAEDLTSMSSEASTITGNYNMSKFRVGLGISAKGDVGVAQGEVKAYGHVYFNKRKKEPKFAGYGFDLSDTSRPLYIITEQDSNDFIGGADGAVGEVVNKVDRKKFRSGLVRALKMSNFIANLASKNEGKKWGISKIKSGFDFSVSGGIALATISGHLAAQLEYKNLDF